MFWVVDSILMWKRKLNGDKEALNVHYHRHSQAPLSATLSQHQAFSDRHSYYKLCSSDSETTTHDNNPVYLDSDLSELGEVNLKLTSSNNS